MLEKTVPLKESRIIGTSILLFLVGFLMSFLPKENWFLLGISEVFAVLCTIAFYILWRIHHDHSKRYFSLLSYVMLIALTIYFLIPIFRMLYGTITFWLCLSIIAIAFILPYVYAKKIAKSIIKPNKSGLSKIYSIYCLLFISFGTLLFTSSLHNSNPEALPIAIFLFFGAILFLFISPVLLIKPEFFKKLK